ncbi:MAG: glycoside hydrolase family 2 protein [Spirochaetaceae bacterium]|jgi:beta-mannosidase|nr:glycoside hydrolase family 2 protein [Spirochaetaceae bacterium]
MVIQKLHTNWKMRNCAEEEFLPATVPGSVYSDLLANKRMEDPFWRDNEDRAFSLLESDFEYRTDFEADPAFFDCDRILLRCHGLDTLAQITINGKLAGSADNMHRTWEFDVKNLLTTGKNSMSIVFHSPIRFVHEASLKTRTEGSSHCLDGFPQIRKAHCMFGWDWGPRLPDAGIWRDIELVGIQKARIDSVYIKQKHRKNSVDLAIEVTGWASITKEIRGGYYAGLAESLFKVPVSGTRTFSYTLSVTDPAGLETVYKGSPTKVTIKAPQLWWPHGYGSQPLYTVAVTLYAGEKEIDRWERRIGLRTLRIHQEKDKWGESFAHEINGVQIFAMGADYIPEDNLLSRVTKERTRHLLEQCVAANYNTIRVWGGGYYPDEFFFDACDELGLLVWQDFMFACAVYDLTEEFDKNIRAECIDVIKRIRHHASLALWCGNNENEGFVGAELWVHHPRQKADYTKMFEYIIPQILKEHDPVTFYWPSSPSSGGSFDNPNDENRGDAHYWDVWHGNKAFSDYRNHFFRYVSEFGFQSFPALKTVESFTEPQDRNIFSYIMEKHQRNDAANGKIMAYLYQTFLYPNDFDTLLYASQLLQAEAIRYGVEHFRRNRGRCMGTLYWQVNDCWPVASWASIDYYGRWKALHYFAKRFFAPVLISCHEEGVLTQNPNPNAQPLLKAALEKSFQLSVVNETLHKKTLSVRWEIRDKEAKALHGQTVPVEIAALSSVRLDKVAAPDLAVNDEYLSYHLYEGEEPLSEGTVIFSLPKYFHFVDPRLRYRVEGGCITISADSYAKSVEIQNENQDMVLSDNYFDMNAGEKTVKIISGIPSGIKVRSVFDIK